ncbi:MAG: exonuclease [Proteobacteria bacterium]|nr:MAG: exonuclease [Pseudomonadota bacterium]QKK11661.1 MAG: exonuclease [Pseudomonadota bacterium]
MPTSKTRSKNEIYVSVDIEADGPIPGPHSMLSIGAVALAPNGETVAEYSANLIPLPEASPHPKTMEWWSQFPTAWEACQVNPREPKTVMAEFVRWVEKLPGLPIFTAWPATWDFMWIYWYLVRFTGKRPFSEHGIDIRSYAMGMRQREFMKCGKNYLPQRWFPEQGHSHVALDDAREQGLLFINMLKENTAGQSE